MAFERAPGEIPRAVYKEKIFGDKSQHYFLNGIFFKQQVLKDMLEFIKGLRDHMKKKSCQQKSTWIFSKLPTRLQNAFKENTF